MSIEHTPPSREVMETPAYLTRVARMNIAGWRANNKAEYKFKPGADNHYVVYNHQTGELDTMSFGMIEIPDHPCFETRELAEACIKAEKSSWLALVGQIERAHKEL